MDLGECPKIHDLALRADFELASKTKDYFYDIDVSNAHVFNFFLFNLLAFYFCDCVVLFRLYARTCN